MIELNSSDTTAVGRVLPLYLFSVPLGLAGLGGAWSAAATLLGATEVPSDVFYLASGGIWLGFTVTYLVGAVRRTGTFVADLRHPLTGPFTAYIPVIAILLIAHYAPAIPIAAFWLCLGAVAALALVSAQLLAHWLTSPLERDSLHPGYFLPVVAGAFIASIGFTSVQAHDAAVATFGVGVFFWLVIGTIVMGRLITGAPLPSTATPSLAILLAPPATAGVAWFAATGGAVDVVQEVLGGVLAFMLILQLVLTPQYLRAPLTMQFWVITFPAAATANNAIRWSSALRFPGWQAIAWSVLTILTAVIALIMATTVWKATCAQIRVAYSAPRKSNEFHLDTEDQ